MDDSQKGYRRSARLRQKAQADKQHPQLVTPPIEHIPDQLDEKPTNSHTHTRKRAAPEPSPEDQDRRPPPPPPSPSPSLKFQSTGNSEVIYSSPRAASLKPVLPRETVQAVKHWILHGKMPEMPKLSPLQEFYSPYTARPKPERGTAALFYQSKPFTLSTSDQSGGGGGGGGESSDAKGGGKSCSIAYNSSHCVDFLEQNGLVSCYSKDARPRKECTKFCVELRDRKCATPKGTVFRRSVMDDTLQRLATKTELGIIRMVGELIVPSAETAVDLGLIPFKKLIVSINEPWTFSIPLDDGVPPLRRLTLINTDNRNQNQQKRFYLPRPQPDYAVGFAPRTFTDDQLAKLNPFIGDTRFCSFFRSTAKMYFPFMTSEVKSRATGLHVAENQNSHSMALCLRAVVYLFRLVHREQELNHRILGFSISHNHKYVTVHGYYPVVSGHGEGKKVTYHRHSILDFTLSGDTRWSSYKFAMAIYAEWVPRHFELISSAVDQLKNVSFDVSSQPEAQFEDLAPVDAGEGSGDSAAGSSEWTPPTSGCEGNDSGSYE